MSEYNDMILPSIDDMLTADLDSEFMREQMKAIAEIERKKQRKQQSKSSGEKASKRKKVEKKSTKEMNTDSSNKSKNSRSSFGDDEIECFFLDSPDNSIDEKSEPIKENRNSTKQDDFDDEFFTSTSPNKTSPDRQSAEKASTKSRSTKVDCQSSRTTSQNDRSTESKSTLVDDVITNDTLDECDSEPQNKSKEDEKSNKATRAKLDTLKKDTFAVEKVANVDEQSSDDEIDRRSTDVKQSNEDKRSKEDDESEDEPVVKVTTKNTRPKRPIESKPAESAVEIPVNKRRKCTQVNDPLKWIKNPVRTPTLGLKLGLSRRVPSSSFNSSQLVSPALSSGSARIGLSRRASLKTCLHPELLNGNSA